MTCISHRPHRLLQTPLIKSDQGGVSIVAPQQLKIFLLFFSLLAFQCQASDRRTGGARLARPARPARPENVAGYLCDVVEGRTDVREDGRAGGRTSRAVKGTDDSLSRGDWLSEQGCCCFTTAQVGIAGS